MRHAIVWLMVFASFTAQASGPELAVQAQAAYKNGNYEQARERYEELLNEGESAELHYNLANCYHRLERPGRAILHYQKALALDPNLVRAEHNLELVRAAAGVGAPENTWIEQQATVLSLTAWCWLGALGFWLALAGIFLFPVLSARRSVFRLPLIMGSVLLTAVSLAALTGYHWLSRQGVAMSADTPVYPAPSDSTAELAFLPEGTMADIRRQTDDFFLIQREEGEGGWVSKEAFEPVWDLF